jgi:hypothetical protein
MQHLVSDAAIEDRPINHIDGDFSPVSPVASHVAIRLDQLAEVDLVVLDGDEAYEMRPG